jgi:hypothetical protein
MNTFDHSRSAQYEPRLSYSERVHLVDFNEII